MYGCESWTIKKAEPQRMGTFELWCGRRLLKAPLTARGSIGLILKETNPEYSLEGLMLKLQYFSHLIRRTNLLKRPWCWERLKAGGEEGHRGWDGRMASPIQWTWTWAKSRRCWGTGWAGALQFMGSQRVRHDLVTEQQQYSISCIYHIFFIHSPTDGTFRLFPHLGSFEWCCNNRGVQIFIQDLNFNSFGSILLELLVYMVVLIFHIFEETLNCFT